MDVRLDYTWLMPMVLSAWIAPSHEQVCQLRPLVPLHDEALSNFRAQLALDRFHRSADVCAQHQTALALEVSRDDRSMRAGGGLLCARRAWLRAAAGGAQVPSGT
jgi:hypothetical protein